MLDGRIAIVTGAAQGIGAELAQGLALAGASVVVTDIGDCAAVAAGIEAAGGQALAVQADVTDDQSLANLVEATCSRFGGLDILVNNAALFGELQLTLMEDIDLEVWDAVMRVNVRGVWQACRAVLPELRRRGGGKILNIASNRVFSGYPGMLHYDASKGAVVAMTRAMAKELGDDGICVNAIAPGLTMSANVLAKDGILDRKGIIAAARAIKRDQEPRDLVGAAVFLSSEQSDFISGQTLVVDGGGILR
ncbi:MAG: SDR family oxidoreductase [Chromatocurvus sp.]